MSTDTNERELLENIHSYLPSEEYLLGSINEITDYQNRIETAKSPAEKIMLMTNPADLSPNAKMMMVKNLSKATEDKLKGLYNNLVVGMYDSLFNEIKPNLVLLKEINDYINAYKLTAYAQEDENIKRVLVNLLSETDKKIRSYMDNKDKITHYVNFQL